MDDFRRRKRQRFQQLLVGRAESVLAVGIHVHYAAHFALHYERHGEFRADVLAELYVARVLRHVAAADGFALARDPAGDAFTEAQFHRGRVLRQPHVRVDLQEARGGIDQDDRPARSAHDAHRLVQDELKRLLRFQRGMDDVADLV